MNIELINRIIAEAVEVFNEYKGQLRYGQCIFNTAKDYCEFDTKDVVDMGVDCFYDDRKVEDFLHYIGENF